MPVGLRISGSRSEIAAAKAAGVSDVIVELPVSSSGWPDSFAALQSAGMRFVLCIDSAAPSAKGILVEPQGYRFAGITKTKRIGFEIPGASTALAVLVTRRDGAVQRVTRVATPEGRFSLDVRPPNSLEHVLLVYPEATSLGQVDCWEGFDAHRDMLLQSLRAHPPGPGLRGLLNPLGNVIRLRSQRSFVPTSKLFRLEFRQYLESRYRSVETVKRSWSMSASDVDSFDGLARLVPLWSASRGVSQLWDPSTDKTYACESRRSSFWAELEIVLNTAAALRFRHLAKAIKKVCDVPVVQEWAGWASPYESGVAELDGLAAKTSGASPSALAAAASVAASSILRWGSKGWLIASRIDLTEIKDPATLLQPAIDDLLSLGARGWFVRSTDPSLMKAVGAESARRFGDASPSQWSPTPLFFPENSFNPATIMRLPGGRWWLPSPMGGNRVDLGSRFFAYRLDNGPQSCLALWTSGGRQRVKLLMAQPRTAAFAAIDGSDPHARVVRGGVEVDVSELPIVVSGTDELPVPEPAVDETVFRFDELIKVAERLRVQAPEELFMFRDALNGFERNPGGNFPAMRTAFDRLVARIAIYNWIEAESIRDTNFSEIDEFLGASSGQVLSLRTAVAGANDAYFADYTFLPRTEDEVEVWLAARIPTEQRRSLKLVIGGQELGPTADPVSHYGEGFGWFRLGVTRLRKTQTTFRVLVASREGIDVSIDAIVFAPGRFAPNGVFKPDPIPYPPTPAKVKRA